MRCHIEWKMGTDNYDVFLYSVSMGRTRLLQYVSGEAWQEVDIEEGVAMSPTFTLHSEWLKVFAKEAAKLPTADDATVAHLTDARETRDRLLRIVEHKMGVQP